MSGRIRTVATWVLGVLAVVALIASTVAVWARTTVADSATFGDITADVLDDPAVQQALADRLADEVLEAVDLDNVLDTLFVGPLANLERLQSTIGAGVRTALSSRLERLLGRERVQALLASTVERAHGAAMTLLRGEGLVDGVTVTEGTIRLNVLPLVGLGLGQLQELGLLDDVALPQLERTGDPDEQVAELSAALGRDLPDDFGQLVVYEGDQVAEATAAVEQAQRAVAVGLRAVWVLLAVTVILLAATIVLARARWRAVLLLSLGVVAGMVLVRSLVHRVVDEAPGLAAAPAGASTVAIILDHLTGGLLALCALLLVLAVVGVVLAVVRRGRRRGDVELAAAVGLGVVVVGVLGVSVVSIVLGVVVAVGAVAVGRALFKTSGRPAEPAVDPPVDGVGDRVVPTAP